MWRVGVEHENQSTERTEHAKLFRANLLCNTCEKDHNPETQNLPHEETTFETQEPTFETQEPTFETQEPTFETRQTPHEDHNYETRHEDNQVPVQLLFSYMQ